MFNETEIDNRKDSLIAPISLFLRSCRAAVAQEVEQRVQISEGCWLDSPCVLEQDPEPNCS